jgi:hypothetical protein
VVAIAQRGQVECGLPSASSTSAPASQAMTTPAAVSQVRVAEQHAGDSYLGKLI